MTGHDDRRSPPASGTRADDDHDAQADPGRPQNTEEEADEAPPPETADALEEQPAVRQAVDDDTSTAAFGEYREEDRGPQAPEFLEPTDSDD
ncbi:hypothetical protein [Streptomyces olivaceoviridis]|uniref:hypothetical protein n=1 Tax=Streptomyces olivaceoviridis TaxID=1921 RepID=UPI0036B1DEC9